MGLSITTSGKEKWWVILVSACIGLTVGYILSILSGKAAYKMLFLNPKSKIMQVAAFWGYCFLPMVSMIAALLLTMGIVVLIFPNLMKTL